MGVPSTRYPMSAAYDEAGNAEPGACGSAGILSLVNEWSWQMKGRDVTLSAPDSEQSCCPKATPCIDHAAKLRRREENMHRNTTAWRVNREKMFLPQLQPVVSWTKWRDDLRHFRPCSWVFHRVSSPRRSQRARGVAEILGGAKGRWIEHQTDVENWSFLLTKTTQLAGHKFFLPRCHQYEDLVAGSPDDS